MRIQSCLFVEPLVEPDNFNFIRVQGDDEELSGWLLIEAVRISMEGIKHNGACSWMSF